MINLFEFAYDNRLFKQFKVTDLLFTEYKCLEERSVFPIWSHYNYFVYVLSGKKKWQTLHTEYLVHAGEAIFVKRGAHIIHKFFEEDFCALIIFVPDHFIKDVVQNNPAQLPKAPIENTDTVIPIHLDEILSAYNLNLEEFARLSGRSLTTFKRDFAETFHTSPGKWLAKKRLDYSRYLLETTDKNINQIAFESGFENTSHYIKVFKEAFGITPLQFQKTISPA